jgi:alpha/beta superfamily hydrolase
VIDEARWDLHEADGTPAAAAVVLHPHPGMGGDRHHPVVTAVAEALADDGVTALRIDLPGPDPTDAVEELVDAAGLACDLAGCDRLVLVGYSWGAVVTALAAPGPDLAARVLVAPPVTMLSLEGSPAEGDAVPTLVLVPTHDQFGPPAAVGEAVGGWPHITVEEVQGADHFLAGHAATVADRTATWVASVLGRDA